MPPRRTTGRKAKTPPAPPADQVPHGRHERGAQEAPAAPGEAGPLPVHPRGVAALSTSGWTCEVCGAEAFTVSGCRWCSPTSVSPDGDPGVVELGTHARCPKHPYDPDVPCDLAVTRWEETRTAMLKGAPRPATVILEGDATRGGDPDDIMISTEGYKLVAVVTAKDDRLRPLVGKRVRLAIQVIDDQPAGAPVLQKRRLRRIP